MDTGRASRRSYYEKRLVLFLHLFQKEVVCSMQMRLKIFTSFAYDPREFMNKLHVSNPIPILRNINSGVNNNEFKMEVVLPNVMDYKDFKKEMQHDKGFEKMIEAMTIGKLSGGSSMNKYRY